MAGPVDFEAGRSEPCAGRAALRLSETAGQETGGLRTIRDRQVMT
jgi:hypothetical protein